MPETIENIPPDDIPAEPSVDTDALLEEWSRTTVEIDGRTFTIRKLLAMEAVRVFEECRPHIGSVIDAFAKTEMNVLMFKLPTILPRQIFMLIEKHMFPHVYFRDEHTPGNAIKVSSNIDRAFDKMPFAYYEIAARAFVVNFSDLWRGGRSRLPLLTAGMSLPGTQTSAT